MSDVINLLTETVTEDIYGNQNITTVPKEVYCEVRSISSNEFFNAGEAGHKPAFRFDVFFDDYANEQRVEYRNVTYYIYRTYLRGDVMELYAEERVGI